MSLRNLVAMNQLIFGHTLSTRARHMAVSHMPNCKAMKDSRGVSDARRSYEVSAANSRSLGQSNRQRVEAFRGNQCELDFWHVFKEVIWTNNEEDTEAQAKMGLSDLSVSVSATVSSSTSDVMAVIVEMSIFSLFTFVLKAI